MPSSSVHALLAATAVITATLVAPAAASADAVDATAKVLKVVDGDTIDIRDDVRGRLRIRVLGIDTPETKKPGYPVECWGPEATAFAQQTLVGQRVAFVPDPTQDRTDRYGRTLAYLVKADGWNYSVEAARAGTAHAYIYDTPVEKHAEIAAAEREARAAGRGLWGPPCYGDTASTPTPRTDTQDGPPPGAPPPAALPLVPPAAAMPPPASSANFDNCDAVRAAGAAPLHRGEPGYRSALDRDRDGIACE